MRHMVEKCYDFAKYIQPIIMSRVSFGLSMTVATLESNLSIKYAYYLAPVG